MIKIAFTGARMHVTVCLQNLLTLLPIGGGGGEFLSHTTIVLAATLKPYKLWLPNFVTSF